MFGPGKLLLGGKGKLKYIGYASSSSTGTATSITVPKPADAQIGDVVVILAVSSSTSVFLSVTGFTYVKQVSVPRTLLMAYRVLDGSEGSTFTISKTGGAKYMVAQALLFRNANYDKSSNIVSGDGSGVLTLPGFTAQAGILIASAFSVNAATDTFSVPSGMTAISAVLRNNSTCMRVFLQDIAAGATGDRSTTLAAGTTFNVGWLASIKQG